MKLIVASFILIMAGGINTFAQLDNIGSQEITMPSPTASSLAKYGNHPVNGYTGTPSIGIPLGKITAGELTIPVGLNYHASGVKVQDQAGWAGMGWSLQAGGVITRTVKGIKDDSLGVGYLYTGDKLVAYEDGSSDQWRYKTTNSTGFMAVLDDIATGQMDGEPDQYNFNFAGISGEMILSMQGGEPEFALFPFKKAFVEYETSGGQIISWVITTSDGAKYYFDVKEDTHIQTVSGTHTRNSYTYTSSWYLSKIESVNSSGNITFSYSSANDRDNYNITTSSQTFVYYDCTLNDWKGKTTNSVTTSFVKNQKYLTGISSSSNQGIIIMSSTRDSPYILNDYRKVDALQFKTNNTITHSYHLNFTSQISDRLFLDNLVLKDKSETQVKKWDFDYFDNYTLPSPTSGSFAIDHWGFYNGKNNDGLYPSKSTLPGTLLPSTYDYFNIDGDRNASQAHAITGALKKITYPTGGSTEFEFELNDYRESGVNKPGGGIRIKKISSNDGYHTTIVKEYRYRKWDNTSESSGVLFNKLDYVDYVDLDNIQDCDDNYYMFYTHSKFPEGPTGGVPVGYSEITEMLKDSSDTNVLGYAVRRFSTPGGQSSDESNYWRRGELETVKYYKSNTNLVKSKHYSYSNIANNSAGKGGLPYYVFS